MYRVYTVTIIDGKLVQARTNVTGDTYIEAVTAAATNENTKDLDCIFVKEE